MARHYYAAFIPYGTSTVPGPYNYPSVYVFDSKSDRDQFVAKHWKYFVTITAKDAHKIATNSHNYNFAAYPTLLSRLEEQLTPYDQAFTQ